MLRHLLAPVNARVADALDLPRTVLGPGVVITFDDGPHPTGTPGVLDELERADAKAMFFVIGEQVQRRPELLREIARRGHLIALHGYRHRLQLRLSAGEVEEDIRRGVAAIHEATDTTPIYHRPPYGIYSPDGLRVARAHHLRPLLWSRWGKDWRKFTTPARIANRVTRDLASGDVILLHDGDFYSASGSHERTVQALAIILRRLKAAEIATVLPI